MEKIQHQTSRFVGLAPSGCTAVTLQYCFTSAALILVHRDLERLSKGLSHVTMGPIIRTIKCAMAI